MILSHFNFTSNGDASHSISQLSLMIVFVNDDDDDDVNAIQKCMPHISTDVNIIDFGNLEFGCPPMKKVSSVTMMMMVMRAVKILDDIIYLPQDLCLTNHTRGSIIVQWIYC